MTSNEDQLKSISTMSIADIARLIEIDWASHINPAIQPYLKAMKTMHAADIPEKYYYDSGTSIIQYCLGNARMYRGETARKIKGELNRRLACAEKGISCLPTVPKAIDANGRDVIDNDSMSDVVSPPAIPHSML